MSISRAKGLTSLLYRREYQLHPPLALLWGKWPCYALVTRGGGVDPTAGPEAIAKSVLPQFLILSPVKQYVVTESAFPNLIWTSEPFVIGE